MSKLQLAFMAIVERQGKIHEADVNTTRYPMSLVESLVKKGYLYKEGSYYISAVL